MKGKLSRLWARMLHNLGLKLASIFLAFVIWFIVAQVGDPKDTRSYNNIQVKLVNAQLLEDQNKCYEVLEQTDKVKVSVTAPTSVFQTLRASDIIAEADVSKLTDINTIAITYYALNTNTDAISFEGDHDSVKLDVENKSSKWVPVRFQTVGTVADGFVIGITKSDQTSVYITGPESAVGQVGSAYAELSVEGATTNSSANVEIRLRDREGYYLDSSTVEMNTDHVLLSAEVLATKEVPIEVNVSGTPAEGYLAVGKPIQDITSVVVAGTATNLARFSKISIPAERLNLDGLTEDTVFQVNVKDYLPENIKLANSDFNGKMTVSVTIKASRERSMEIPAQNVTFVNVPTGFLAELPAEDADRLLVSIKVFGLRDTVNALRANTISGTADIAEWMKNNGLTTLTPGMYEVPVKIDLGDEVTVLEVGKVRTVISKPEEEQ